MAKRSTRARTPDPAPAGPGTSGVVEAFFRPDLGEHIRKTDFLQLAYTGGIAYKHGKDAEGDPVLIEHEEEVPERYLAGLWRSLNNTAGNTPEQIKLGRFARRLRMACYENHCGPIADKIAAYLTRNAPDRDEKKREEHLRVRLDEQIAAMIDDGLQLSEAWIGVDAAPVPAALGDGTPVTELVARRLDPRHAGKRYVVLADPRRVVDFDADPETGEITRVVIEEREETKAGFTARCEVRTFYKEWTAEEWVRYVAVDSDGNELAEPVAYGGSVPVRVRETARGRHAFGVCPWHRFRPDFPTEDLADLNRALFNVSSLLDEELYRNTFTQKWITGQKVEDVQKAQQGSGNVLVLEDPAARIGVLEAIPGHAESLRNRMQDLRDAIYQLVSMDATGTKNVAEAAEKKKRDLEALYTMLLRITERVERAENWLLVRLGLLDDADGENRTEYDKKFDVQSLTELVEQIAALRTISYVPPSVKRRLVQSLVQKIEPTMNAREVAGETDGLVDADPEIVESVATMLDKHIIDIPLAAALLGIPEAKVGELARAAEEHAAREAEAARGAFGAPEEDGDVVDEEDGGGPGSGAGDPGRGRGPAAQA